MNATISYVWCEARQHDRAVAAALKALELDSGAPLTHMLLGRAYMMVNEPRKAIASLTTAARLSGRLPAIEANLGYAYARAGFWLICNYRVRRDVVVKIEGSGAIHASQLKK